MAKMNHIFGRKFKIFNHSVFVVSTNCCSQKRVKNKVRFFVYNSVSFSPTDKIWISLKSLWNFWSNELIRSPKFEKNYVRAQAFLTIFFLKRAPPNKGKLQKKDAICCQNCIILEQSKWSHAGCLNTANLATSQAELASEASFCLSFLINSWFFRLKYWFQGQIIPIIHLILPNAYKPVVIKISMQIGMWNLWLGLLVTALTIETYSSQAIVFCKDQKRIKNCAVGQQLKNNDVDCGHYWTFGL